MDSNVNLQTQELDIPHYSQESLEIHRVIGNGLHAQVDEDHSITLCLAATVQRDESWLQVALKISDNDVQLLCKESLWLDFIRPILPIDCFESIPSDLMSALTSSTLASFTGWLKESGIEISMIENIRCAESINWQSSSLSLSICSPLNLGQQLRFYVQDISLATVQTLAKWMTPLDMPSELTKLPIACAVGVSRLTVEQLKSLHVGDCIVLQWSGSFATGELLLFQNKPVSIVKYVENKGFIVEQMMNEFDELLDLSDEDSFPGLSNQEQAVDLEKLVVPVVMEVGQIDVSISELATLCSGSILETELKASLQVKLKANGKVIGFGSLVQFDDKLAVEIEQIAS
ncbi:type III secretion system cytoplasmic ring protein SctQ [Vibrio marisflavi]|uniref:Flagellar motor switch protein FliN-like C-terminal domain-containing protein n=1 Tax=Vibrio marisflavi CECT 7928 TaxID=634439 RepID=A0ABM8ZYG8_9VIBR|nr:type III secretion system cytoplasmic ring protein SctQ [Vibrio marisflavi]CAH0535995.1 hypothetical protein VMF7928_00090 [Vibrio marisflavi CECT 7928]